MAEAAAAHRPAVPWRVAAGLVAGALAVGLAELLAGVLEAVPSPIVAVGEAAVDHAPAALRDTAISVLGTATKPVLVGGILAVLGCAAAGLGLLASRSSTAAAAGVAALAGVGLAGAATQTGTRLLPTALVLAVPAAAAIVLLRLLLGPGGPRPRGARVPDDPPAFDRRAFVRLLVGGGAVAAAAAASGRALTAREQVRAQQAAVALPRPAEPLATPPDLAEQVPGLAPRFTPNETFYRIDTALSAPAVDLARWRLRIVGMVRRTVELDYDALLGAPLVEADATLVCVSNEVGGSLVGNARWLGVPLAELLERAGVQPAATQVVGRAVDGWTAGFPTPIAFDGRSALLAVGMNGEPLPREHGFPARLVVPGLYGYVSATKWLQEIELTTWEGFDAYWVPRGWAKEGPVKTQSRIDVPRHGATVPAGRVAVAGVAWAQPRGIERVEVEIDGEGWRDATLVDDPNPETWRQWTLPWEATPGSHVLRVRATDGDGQRQVSVASLPQPDGATGLHTIRVTVT